MKKALITATIQPHIAAFHLPLIHLLHEHGYEVHVAARSVEGDVIKARLEAAADKVYDIPFERSPFSAGNRNAYKQLKNLIDENNYDVIHCNTPVGGILTRVAAKKARKHGCTVIYTAHGFHFYNGASKKNWLVFYPLERFFAQHLTDCLVTICDEDEKNAREKKIGKNVRRIHGVGVDKERFFPVRAEEKLRIRQELGLEENAKICLCTGELNANKNQSLFVSAVPEILEKCPEFRLLLAGTGDRAEELKKQLADLHIEHSVTLLGMRSDIDKLAKACDFAASASIREGLGINIVEAMCCAKPAAVSHNRGHNELVAEGESGVFFSFADSHAAARAILKLCDDEACRAMGEKAFERSEKYTTAMVIKELESIYEDNVFSKNNN